MSNETTIKKLILQNFAADDRGEDIWVLLPLEHGDKLLVFVQISKGYLQVSAPFAEAQNVSAERAISTNFSFFGIGRDNDWWYVKNVAKVDNLNLVDVSEVLNSAANLAIALASELGQRKNVLR